MSDNSIGDTLHSFFFQGLASSSFHLFWFYRIGFKRPNQGIYVARGSKFNKPGGPVWQIGIPRTHRDS